VQKQMKIQIIIGSTRPGRFSEKPAEWIFEELKNKSGVEAEIVDLRDYAMPFFESVNSPSRANGKYDDEIVQKFAGKIKQADAFIIISPEYNHGPSSVLKNAMDSVYIEWNNKPVGFVSYGSVGGARAIEQLRQVAIELQMAPIRNSINIFNPWLLLDEKGNLKEGSFDQLKDTASAFIDQLIWWAGALKSARG